MPGQSQEPTYLPTRNRLHKIWLRAHTSPRQIIIGVADEQMRKLSLENPEGVLIWITGLTLGMLRHLAPQLLKTCTSHWTIPCEMDVNQFPPIIKSKQLQKLLTSHAQSVEPRKAILMTFFFHVNKSGMLLETPHWHWVYYCKYLTGPLWKLKDTSDVWLENKLKKWLFEVRSLS